MADAYVLQGKAWASGTVVFQMGLGNSSQPLQDGNISWDAAVLPIFSMWDQEIGRVQVTGVVNPGTSAGSGDGVNTIMFSNSVFGQSFGSSTLAVTYYRMSTTMTEADVLFNAAQNFNSYRGRLQFASNGYAIGDIRRVLLHEMGHALGLGHPDAQHVDAVMNAMMSDRETLSSDDINGGHALYGVGSPTPDPTPTPTPTPAPTATPAPTPTASSSHLANISTRMNVGVNDDVMIAGFIVKGSDGKRLVLRASGPSLTVAGVSGAMADPMLELHDASGAVIAENDDWQDGGQVDELVSAGFAPHSAQEPALIRTLAPGSYTAIVRGYNSSTGAALVEGYELDSNTTKLANLSTRGRVDVGDGALIGGIIVQGSVSKNVILRARGPSMSTAANPFPGVLPDPTLELRDVSGNLLASNDNWGSSSQASAIAATGLAPSNSLESAILSNLAPGSYTAIVRGANISSGIGLVEVFDLEP